MPPTSYNPAITPEFSELVLQMIRKNPGRTTRIDAGSPEPLQPDSHLSRRSRKQAASSERSQSTATPRRPDHRPD